MERATVEIYEDRGDKWAARMKVERKDAAEAFGSLAAPGKFRIDVGCGSGRYTGSLGRPCIGLDAARSMLQMCAEAVPEALLVQADMEALPFAHGSVDLAWANMSYLHVPRKRLPVALADLHRMLSVGAPLDLQVLHGEFEGTGLPDDRIGGRFFAAWEAPDLGRVLTGAGFEVVSHEVVDEGPGNSGVLRMRATRQRTLPDNVGPGMRLLVCGLNPSVYSADAGIGFARPGNRFWPAAVESGLVTEPRDTRRALEVDRIGMTDIVKRATPNASLLSPDEYRAGTRRVEELVSWLEPEAVLFVGLAGWRSTFDPKATAGVQPLAFGGRPAYVMPSTSGINASSRLEDLTEHMRAALELADNSR
jgi:double-stranded uracil-DNA glycosylase